jgi:glycosyltransferase involved in cell wall biosynthesis
VLAEALNEMKSDYTLVLMGREQYDGVNKIKKIYGNTIYLGYFPPPQHLQITSYAYIGIANYDDSSLNNLFCAPNKIYEYTGFGIPVLCSNVPGLINTIGMNQAGECVDFTDKQSIIKGIEKIERNYQFYSTNASIFYSKADNNTVFDSIVSLLKN